MFFHFARLIRAATSAGEVDDLHPVVCLGMLMGRTFGENGEMSLKSILLDPFPRIGIPVLRMFMFLYGMHTL